MKRWLTVSIILLLLPAFTIFALGARDTTTKNADDLMKGVNPTLEAQSAAPASKAALAAFDRFALELLQKSHPADKNSMISPLSVYLALGMTLNGARGQTSDEMLSVLGDSKLAPAELNAASRYWLDSINSEQKDTTLSIANSVWFDQRYTPSEVFLQTNANYYSAAVRKLDFADAGAPAVINRWVDDATKGTIDKIVDTLDPDSLMVLINTVYFLSDWATTFNPHDTYDRTFHAPGNDSTTAFMSRTSRMAYLKGQDAAGIALPYVDKRYVFFALMPDDSSSLQEWLADRKPETFLNDIREMVSTSTTTLVDLSIPKFEARYEDSLVNELGNMGMKDAFISNKADFSAMSAEETKDLFIGDVIHKTFIRVDEKGTEAAAVTAVMMAATAMAFEGVTLVFDQPFFYGIIDIKTGLPLFLGVFFVPDTKLI